MDRHPARKNAGNQLARWRHAGMALTVGLALCSGARGAPVGWLHEAIAQGAALSLSDPSINSGYLAYTTPDVVVRRSFAGTRLAVDLNTPLPSARFLSFGNWVSVDEDGGVSFAATVSSPTGTTSELFSWSGSTPASLGVEANFFSRSAGLTAYTGTAYGKYFVDTGGTSAAVAVIGDTAPTLLPGYTATFKDLAVTTDLDWNNQRATAGWDMAFYGTSRAVKGTSSGEVHGVYVATGLNRPEVVAEQFMAVPGSPGETFQAFEDTVSISDGQVAFTGIGTLGKRGVYLGTAGGIVSLMADTRTLSPNGGYFTDFGTEVAVDRGSVVFSALDDQGRWGVYVNAGGVVYSVFDQGDVDNLLPGNRLGAISLEADAISGAQVAFRISTADATSVQDRIILSTAVAGSVPLPGTLALVALCLPLCAATTRRRVPIADGDAPYWEASFVSVR